MPIATGTKLGQYEVQDFIGQGAMGLVYRAYHPQLERTGAVKVMQAISPDIDTVTRFRHEAQAIAKMRHPNIVDVYDFGEFQGTPYMIVEYVPGGSLAAKMNRGKLDTATAIKYLRGIAAGLDYAHGHGVVHRDVKPANVLLTTEDSPVLADFGLAKLLQGSSLKSMTGVTTGTPAYMAPEQVAGREVGPAADRYSLATIAYEMLTGVIPFDGEALLELLYAQVHRDPLPPSSRYPDLGPAVDAVIMRGLSKNPSDRWETCTALVDALEAALTGAPAASGARTQIMAPPKLASTVPLAPPAPRVAARRAQATVAMPFPAPAPIAPTAPLVAPAAAVAAKPRRRVDRRVLFGVAAALVLALVLGLCTIAAAATSLTVSPNIATPGETVNVTALHVPANQSGVIELHSIVRTYPFRADSGGHVNTYVPVPHDIPLGNHTIKICWTDTCHASASLRVVSGVAMTSPTPVAHETPSPSSGASPTPGGTPQPTSTPGSSPRPTSPPASTPKSTPPPPPPPTPSPTPNPCPTSSQAASVTTSPGTVLAGVTTVTVSGQNFTPNKSFSVTYTAPNGARRVVGSGTVACNGTLSASFVPGAVDIGTATVFAADAGGRSASHSFTIT